MTARYVLYWMQQAQRAEDNPALQQAILEANRRALPVVVGFGLMDDYPEATARHYAFMLQGLADVATTLARRRIAFVVRRGSPPTVALTLATQAALVVCDVGYLRHQRAWRDTVAREAPCPVVMIETDVIVPVRTASAKHEYAARTFRPRILKHIDEWLALPRTPEVRHDASALNLTSDIDVRDTVAPATPFVGGTTEARRKLRAFDIARYAASRSDPVAQASSQLSPYLHFGQLSPTRVALAIRESKRGTREDRGSFLEELIVRRELAINHVYYEPRYDQYQCIPDWARKTLGKHAPDPRDPIYSREQLEAGSTHDSAWNTAMREMRDTGFLHNAMRMYWGKKILEWSRSPEEAFETALALNNRYFLDGRDASSFTNVGWLFGLHDRPWGERAIYGTVRSMTLGGLRRKFDVDAYIGPANAAPALDL